MKTFLLKIHGCKEYMDFPSLADAEAWARDRGGRVLYEVKPEELK